MSIRCIATVSTEINNTRFAKVFRDSDLEEYRVKLYENMVYQPDADYFTDDKADALATAKMMIGA